MKKDLPDVFPVPVNKKIDNVQSVYYGKEDRKIKDNNDNLSIESKINRIFNSTNYIYKKEVTIKTNNNQFSKTLVGRTPECLLTMDNEKINISDIIDIY